jgi:hypothetical protein
VNAALRGIEVDVKVVLVTEVCIQCGGVFAVPSDLVAELRRNHKRFYCPVGHDQFYPAKSPEEQLRAELAQEQRKLAEAERQRQRISALLDQEQAACLELGKQNRKLEREAKKLEREATATARLTTNGVCTLCHRSLAALASHMHSKHPDAIVTAEQATA